MPGGPARKPSASRAHSAVHGCVGLVLIPATCTRRLETWIEKRTNNLHDTTKGDYLLREEFARVARRCMPLQEVGAGAFAALGARVEAMLLQDSIDRGLGDRPDAQLLELPENPSLSVSFARFRWTERTADAGRGCGSRRWALFSGVIRDFVRTCYECKSLGNIDFFHISRSVRLALQSLQESVALPAELRLQITKLHHGWSRRARGCPIRSACQRARRSSRRRGYPLVYASRCDARRMRLMPPYETL